MSDNDDDMFADSDDTDELISQSKKSKPVAVKKKRLKKRALPKSKKISKKSKKQKKIPDADNDSDDAESDDDFGDSGGGDDTEGKELSKRERMEALRKKKLESLNKSKSVIEDRTSDQTKTLKNESTNIHDDDDADSVDSAQFQLNEDDRNFIDTEGDDAEAINELYAEQHFDDEEENMEDNTRYDDGKKKKGRGGGGSKRRDNDRLDLEADKDNPIMQAVIRMKKRKKVAKTFTELEGEAKEFIEMMEKAADDDEEAMTERRPAFAKLTKLTTVIAMLTRCDMTRQLLDGEVLKVCRRWIQPLPNGTLGNVTVRQRLTETISKMTGEMGINPSDLKRSDFGKTIMTLYMHKSETPAMKRQLKSLIEQWSRPIFQKSGNMRDLQHANKRGGGLSRLSKQYQQEAQRNNEVDRYKTTSRAGNSNNNSKGGRDLQTLISSGADKKGKEGMKRVRVPYSKGFQYTIRPQGRVASVSDKPRKPEASERGNLSKRMMEKGRAVSKNGSRSKNVSVQGKGV